jgi:hypothetical protein
MRDIVLVHGFGSQHKSTWGPFCRVLRKIPSSKSWALIPFEYPTKKVRLPFTDIAPDINRLAQGLRTLIRNRCNRSTQLLLCGHSMGGLVIRKYLVEALKLSDQLPPRLACICYATPHNGAQVARLSAMLSKNNSPADQMQPGSEFLTQLNTDWSNLAVEKRVLTRFVLAGQDSIVPPTSSQGDWGTRNLEVIPGRDHTSIVKPENGISDLSICIAVNLLAELSDHENATVARGWSLMVRFEQRFAELDGEVADVLPKGILSPRARTFVPFESKHLFHSLASLGMPVAMAFEVIEAMAAELLDHAMELDEVSTRDLRRLVSDAIHGLASRGAEDAAVDQWVAGYVGRYGHADDRVTVVREGELFPLDYNYLRHSIVPDVVQRVTGTALSDISRTTISGSAIYRMAGAILETGNSLGIYNFAYDSLLALATDIAVKPPHPWFVERAGHSETVKYDLERASRWLTELPSRAEAGTQSGVAHAVGECMHHSASAFLGHYGAFLGIGYLAPVRQLIHHLTVDQPAAEWAYCVVGNIKTELETVGETSAHALTEINWMSKRVRNITPEWYDEWLQKSAWLEGLARQITSHDPL